jgi:hypothetical protein
MRSVLQTGSPLYILSLSLSGYKLKEIPSIMLYYVGVGEKKGIKKKEEEEWETIRLQFSY